jgi:DNA-binding MarR family transcriptional regulator
MGKTNPGELDEHIGYWLRCLSNFVSHTFAEKLSTKDVSVPQWVVLRTLFASDGMTLKHLTAQIGVDKGSLSRTVERLLQKGLVSRVDGNDRRTVGLSLTKAGKKLVPQLSELADENDEFFFHPLSRPARQQFLATIKRLLTANGWDKAARGRDGME